MNEVVNVLGLPRMPRGGLSFYIVFKHFLDHAKDINYFLPAFIIIILIVFQYLLKRYPRIPWHSIVFILAMPIGYFMKPILKSGRNLQTILGVYWPNTPALIKDIQESIRNPLDSSVINTLIIFDPYFIINMVAMAVLTYIECIMTIELVKVLYNKKTNRGWELVGVGVSNVLMGVFGLTPCSLPTLRNTLVYSLNATSSVFCLLAAFFAVLFGWLIYPLAHQVPMLVSSIFNLSLGLSMIDFDILYFYFKYNRKYAWVFVAVILGGFALHIIFSLLLSWILFFAYYFSQVPKDNFTLGVFKEVSKRFEEYNEAIEERYKEDETSANLLKGGNRQNQLLEQIERRGVIYQLKGRFNFIYYHAHVQNIMNLNKEIVLLDFYPVWDNDLEFIRSYGEMIEQLKKNRINFYITGIPKEIVGDNRLLRKTWIEVMDEEDRILYTK